MQNWFLFRHNWYVLFIINLLFSVYTQVQRNILTFIFPMDYFLVKYPPGSDHPQSPQQYAQHVPSLNFTVFFCSITFFSFLLYFIHKQRSAKIFVHATYPLTFFIYNTYPTLINTVTFN